MTRDCKNIHQIIRDRDSCLDGWTVRIEINGGMWFAFGLVLGGAIVWGVS